MTNRSKTPRTDKTIEKIKRDFGSDYPMMFGALQAHCEIQERELTAAQALAERQWIPVTERLPEGKEVVLAADSGEVHKAWLSNGRWLGDNLDYDGCPDTL